MAFRVGGKYAKKAYETELGFSGFQNGNSRFRKMNLVQMPKHWQKRKDMEVDISNTMEVYISNTRNGQDAK